MKIAVPVKFVPDLVEELTIDPSGAALDATWLRLIINEFDDHAVEQAILLKERGGGQVTVMTIQSEGADDFLFAAAAKGADQLIKLTGDFNNANNHALARIYANLLKESKPDLIITGVQAHNDLDGSLGPLLAEYLGLPYVGYIAGLTVAGDKVSSQAAEVCVHCIHCQPPAAASYRSHWSDPTQTYGLGSQPGYPGSVEPSP